LRTPVAGEIQMELLVRPVMEFTLRRRLYARADRVTAETVDEWWRPIAVKGTRAAALASVRTNTRAAAGILANIRVSTAVVWGKEDSLLPASEGRRLAGRIGGAVFLEIPGAGHLPQEEMPDEFGRAVSGFLRTLPNGEASPNGGASGTRF
jgi:pimeloyl-ACP methyl ester carboxylesterase